MGVVVNDVFLSLGNVTRHRCNKPSGFIVPGLCTIRVPKFRRNRKSPKGSRTGVRVRNNLERMR